MGEQPMTTIQSYEAQEPLLITGDGIGALGAEQPGAATVVEGYPRGLGGLLCLAERIEKGQSDTASELVPNYLQITEAERQALLRRQ